MVSFIHPDEKRQLWEIFFEVLLQLLQDLGCFGSGDLGEALLVARRNEVACYFGSFLDYPLPQLRIVETIVCISGIYSSVLWYMERKQILLFLNSTSLDLIDITERVFIFKLFIKSGRPKI
jgi:hypothetical protein